LAPKREQRKTFVAAGGSAAIPFSSIGREPE